METTCSYCNKIIADNARYCSHCGIEQKQDENTYSMDKFNSKMDDIIKRLDNNIQDVPTIAGLDYKCPVCKSENIKRLPIAYSEGISDVKLNTSGGGVVIGSNGIGLGIGSSDTKGISQSRLSSSISPPSDNTDKFYFIFTAILATISFITFRYDSILFGSIFAVLGIISLLFAISGESEEQKKKRIKWENSYICLRCGVIHLRERTS